jgi:hypothetical protein
MSTFLNKNDKNYKPPTYPLPASVSPLPVSVSAAPLQTEELNIYTLIQRSNKDIEMNLFTKDELKQIFIKNYSNMYGQSVVFALNNNQSYQCFRNASFYFLARLQFLIWKEIDNLPDITNYSELKDVEKQKYIFIQTFVELLCDDIINNIYKDTRDISRKRTSFLDYRLDKFEISDADKYKTCGLLQYKIQFHKQRMGDFGMTKEDYEPYSRENGGLSESVLGFFLPTIFSNNLKSFDVRDITDIITEFNKLAAPEPDYVSVEIKNQIYADTFFKVINTHKRITTSSGSSYRLVSILYDCINGIAHQIVSMCFGTECVDTPPKHTFHDDQIVIKQKALESSDFERGKDTNLQWACKTGGLIVKYLLYEKETIIPILQTEVEEFLKTKNVSAEFIAHGGNIYLKKYLKYKNKYMKKIN